MLKFLYTIGLIIGGLLLGKALKTFVDRKYIPSSIPLAKSINIVRNIVVLGLFPLLNLGVFWIVEILDPKLIMLPTLGVFALTLGGFLGIAASKILKLDRRETGSMYVTSSFTNLGAIGGLICFVFLGATSYAFVSMYRLFEEFYYYTIGFSVAKLYGKNIQDEDKKGNKILDIILDPYIMLAFLSIVIGLGLNLTGVKRPAIYGPFINLLIPLTTFLLAMTIGFDVRFTAVGAYLKECLSVSIIKFLIIPIIITSIAYFLGAGELHGGMILKVILILSAMPSATLSLIPPQIYDLDLDLANSIWLFTTGALIVVMPALYIIQNMF